MKDRNKNRPGYKSTKIGWIPEKWNCVSADSISGRITVGIVIEPAKWYVPNGIKAFRSLNISNGRIIDNNWVYISDEGNKKNSKSIVFKDDLLIVRTGEPGVCCVVTPKYHGCNCIDLIILTPKKEKVFPSFLCDFITSPIGKMQILRSQGGLAQKHLNVGECRRLWCPLPPITEQKKIANILSSWDTVIKQTRKLITAKKNRKIALMQQLLTGKKRLPGFQRKKGRKKYRFFNLPIDWECPSIREIAEERSERNGGNNKVTVLSCSKHKGFIESSKYFGRQVFSEDTSNYKIIRRGWFGYPSNHIEEGSIGLSDHDKGIVSPIYTVFECSNKVVPEYLYALFKTETFRHVFAISTNASVDRRGSLRWQMFSLIRVPLPGKDEQQSIANVLAEADNEIVDLENKLKSLEKQKRGLMQKLLTGEVRVKI